VPSDAASDGYGQMLEPTTQAAARRVLTDAQGAFELRELDPRGTFIISANRPLGGEARLENVRAGQDVEILLETPGKVTGTAIDANGRPVPRFQVTVTNRAAGQILVKAFAASNGSWAMEDVAPGALEIAGTIPTGNGEARITRELKPGEALADVVLELRPGAVAHQ
jgi:hypothetical protein